MHILVIGGTGLAGFHFVLKAQDSIYINKITILSRKPTNLFRGLERVSVIVNEDSEKWDQWISTTEMVFDMLFSALGSKSGDLNKKNSLKQIDHDLNVKLAESAKYKGTKSIVMITSFNNPCISTIFPYFRMKQQIENSIIQLNFERTIILRPGPIVGDRRTVGQIDPAIPVLLSNIIGKFAYKSPFSFFVGYSIKVEELAQAAVYHIETNNKKLSVIDSYEMVQIAECLESI